MWWWKERQTHHTAAMKSSLGRNRLCTRRKGLRCYHCCCHHSFIQQAFITHPGWARFLFGRKKVRKSRQRFTKKECEKLPVQTPLCLQTFQVGVSSRTIRNPRAGQKEAFSSLKELKFRLSDIVHLNIQILYKPWGYPVKRESLSLGSQKMPLFPPASQFY